ncbi:EF-P 5-aminopentanol modification-associated protein YfmH [Lacticaseibacillus saniviri]|uniref:Peptidase n=1 Tax=Lacticaseibacillus saniviri JCM 17471 = DSM 24301 TaxID=1293598 RepID=A0A0R2MT58_9LACO|nr:pitrilysin family protein [Lacticaseibacillus saniviri]KRO16774.1 peptidase [Lacticaseibacillus saniviri JCM 17471 = DSM 24301]MCG4281756.1 insulinase family protein [Lacticaseibacillus saniviri]
MEKIDYSDVGESLYRQVLDNGLTLLIVPKPQYHKTYAMMTANYGAIDTRFMPAGETQFVTQPDGIAHFLEHKLFEKADHDAFDLFGQTGASANAFTGTTKTSYLFSTTDAVAENLTILLDFVQDPYFTQQSVDKEKGIIGQEIQMYQDDPNWRLYLGMIGNLYPTHPVRIDVAGTQESIAKITPEMLYQVHQTFYQPSNMTLTVVGNVDPEAIAQLVASNQAKKQLVNQPFTRGVEPDYDVTTILPYRLLEMPITRPKSIVGIKGLTPIADTFEGMKQSLTIRLLLEAVFGDSSTQYLDWYNQGIVDDSFDFDFTTADTYNFATISGDVADAGVFSDAVIDVIAKGAEQPELNETRFNQLKRAAIGKYYQSLNSLEGISNQLSAQSFSETSIFDFPRQLEAITLADLRASAAEFFNVDAVSVFHIVPEAE